MAAQLRQVISPAGVSPPGGHIADLDFDSLVKLILQVESKPVAADWFNAFYGKGMINNVAFDFAAVLFEKSQDRRLLEKGRIHIGGITVMDFYFQISAIRGDPDDISLRKSRNFPAAWWRLLRQRYGNSQTTCPRHFALQERTLIRLRQG